MTDAGDMGVSHNRQANPLEGSTALVTAGGGAIGSATAALLARDGAHVLIAGRTRSALEDAAERIAAAAEGGPGTVRWVVADALDEDHVVNLVARTAEPTGRIDIAVGVVGGGGGATPILETTVDIVEEVLRRNVIGAFLLLKHAGQAMVEGGGSIVAVSSMQATQTAPMLGPYCASKAGLEMLYKVAADELGQYGIRVNMVRPGLTTTGKPAHPSSDDNALAAYMEQQPIARPGQPEDIAAGIRYLVGPESTWVTGTTLTVDGGTSLRRFPDLSSFWAGLPSQP